ncbi:MAG: site-specific integrase [Candidatus Aenigmatarchaeota archaeon]
MDKRLDVHNNEQTFANSFGNLKNDADITPANKKTLEEYIHFCVLTGFKKNTLLKKLFLGSNIAKMLKKPFDQCDRKDIEGIVGELISTDRWSERTKQDHKVFLKTFFKWLRKSESVPAEVAWIRGGKKIRFVSPESLLTEDDIKKMVKCAADARDQALIYTLYESAGRIEEVLNLRIKNVMLDSYGCQVFLEGKTGMRRVRLFNAVSYILAWINSHPHKDDKDAPLWIPRTNRENSKEFMSYPAAAKTLKTIARKAGITKRINAHFFRHSRLTELASYLSDSQLREFAGWTSGSPMAGVYVHMSGKNVDNKLLDIFGLRKEKDIADEAKKREIKDVFLNCPRCKTHNPLDAKFCSQCWLPLDSVTAQKLLEVEKARDEVMTNPKHSKLFKEFLTWMQNNNK